MKIRITDLPPDGLPVSDHLSLEALNARLNEGQGSDIRFTTPPKVDVLVARTVDGAETKGKVSTRYLQGCGRCTEEIERALEIELNFILKPKPLDADAADSAEFEDDLGIIFFEGEHLDLESAVQESLILSLSRYWSPPVDNSGNCSICQRNCKLNPEVGVKATRLGDLFKKAGVK